jgi:hypothetical protein
MVHLSPVFANNIEAFKSHQQCESLANYYLVKVKVKLTQVDHIISVIPID